VFILTVPGQLVISETGLWGFGIKGQVLSSAAFDFDIIHIVLYWGWSGWIRSFFSFLS